MEVFGVGIGEMLLIAVVALIVLGPDRLPEAMKQLGKAVGEFRRAIEPARAALNDVTREFTEAAQPAASKAAPAAGNPWQVHPLAEGMNEDEKDQFFKTGELPQWKRQELDARDARGEDRPPDSVSAGDMSSGELSYPSPHGSLAQTGDSPFAGRAEALEYPAPAALRDTSSGEGSTPG